MQAKTVKEVLIAARWILDNVGWCQGTSNKDAQGNIVHLTSSNDRALREVAAFCAAGAVYVVDADKKDLDLHMSAIQALNKRLPAHVSLVHWNDALGRSKREVLDLFNEVIEDLS